MGASQNPTVAPTKIPLADMLDASVDGISAAGPQFQVLASTLGLRLGARTRGAEQSGQQEQRRVFDERNPRGPMPQTIPRAREVDLPRVQTKHTAWAK